MILLILILPGAGNAVDDELKEYIQWDPKILEWIDSKKEDELEDESDGEDGAIEREIREFEAHKNKLTNQVKAA